jgi:hypothetical protein
LFQLLNFILNNEKKYIIQIPALLDLVKAGLVIGREVEALSARPFIPVRTGQLQHARAGTGTEFFATL